MSGFISNKKLKILVMNGRHFLQLKRKRHTDYPQRNVCTVATNHPRCLTQIHVHNPIRCHNKSVTLSQSSLFLSLPTGIYYNGFCTFLVNTLLKYPHLNTFSVREKRYYSRIYDTFEDQPTSWLFVSDAVAGAYGAQVNLDLDLEKRLSSPDMISALRKNIQHRKMQFDLDTLVSEFEEMTNVMEKRQEVDKRRKELLLEIKKGKEKKQAPNMTVQDDIYSELNECKSKMKNLMNDIWSLEDKIMRTALKLPNDLHTSTPLESPIIVKENPCEIGTSSGLSHVDIGKEFDLIKFSNVGPQAYYLKGQLAYAAKKLSDFACHYFQNQNYRLMSGPEFFKTPIMESCGQDVHKKDEVLTLKHLSRDIEPMNHLSGVSLMTFAAYLAKLCVGDPSLPLKMFAIGPHYRNVTTDHSHGLYGPAETTQVATFCCTTQSDAESCFDDMVDTLWNFLSSFGFSIRLVRCCASSLRREERRKTQVEIWVPSRNKFISIASVSDHGDYISRRLMSSHNQNHGDIRHTKLLHMISGTAVNLTTLLAVWMEVSPLASTAHGTFSLQELPVISNYELKKATIT